MNEKSYKNEEYKKLQLTSINYLIEQANHLYDKSLIFRYYNNLSWVFGVTDNQITSFKQLYEMTLKELQNQPEIKEMPLTNEKVKNIILSFPKFDEKQFIISNYGTGVLRGFFASIFIPYTLYLMYKNIKKTRQFRKLLSSIIENSKAIVDIINTNNIENWLELQSQKKQLPPTTQLH